MTAAIELGTYAGGLLTALLTCTVGVGAVASMIALYLIFKQDKKG